MKEDQNWTNSPDNQREYISERNQKLYFLIFFNISSLQTSCPIFNPLIRSKGTFW